jgi:hypothetical protein
MGKALDTLENNLNCGESHAENTAAKAILDYSFKINEIADLAEQMEKLREQVQRLTNGDGSTDEGIVSAASNGEQGKQYPPDSRRNGHH